MLFLAGVPGALKRLKDRLVPSGTTETRTDARMLKLDNLDATVASRAPSSTALSSATWTGTKAGYLDAAVSSVKMKPQVNMVRDTSVAAAAMGTLAYELEGYGAAYTAGAPGQTAATAFRTGGTEAFEYGSAYYWSCSEYSATGAWLQVWYSSSPGYQYSSSKSLAYRVRACRRPKARHHA